MKSLTRVVVGDGSVFGVIVEDNQKVRELKRMIKDEKPSIAKCEADRLTLYVANKGENWLTSDKDWLPSRGPDVKLLKQKQTPDEISAIMTESRKMNSADEIGDVFASAPTKKVIHVLVNVPEAAAGVVSETSSTAQMVKERNEQIVQTKRKQNVHSEMSSNEGLALLQDLNICVVPARSIPFATEDPTAVQPST
nr:crinkler 25 [Plasmopara viticola]